MDRRWAISLIVVALTLAAWLALQQSDISVWYNVFAGGCVAIALIGVYYLLVGVSMAAVLVRAVFALVPVGLFAGGLIYTVLQIDALEPRVAQALIAAVVVASGWVVAYMTGEWRRVGTEQERRRDLVQASITELELISEHGRIPDWDAVIEETRAAFRKNARHDVFVFYGHQFITLKRLVDQIEVLKWRQIAPVMHAYQSLDRLERMEERMHSEAFAALPKYRREEGIVRYLKISAAVPDRADNAIKALRDGPFQGWLRNLR